jgi:hypothetical protein
LEQKPWWRSHDPLQVILCAAFFAEMASGQSSSMTKTIQSIGAGPFEFPISGTFTISQEGGGSVFSAQNGDREIRVGFLRNPAASQSPEQMTKTETRVKGSWERFAAEEKMEVIRPFKRWDLSSSLVIFGMASQYTQSGALRHYVQFAVADGPQMAFLIVEGSGPAESAATELEAQVLRVKVPDVSNASLQKDAPKAARP